MKKIFPILAVLGSAAALIAYKMKKEEEKQIIDLDQGLLYDDEPEDNEDPQHCCEEVNEAFEEAHESLDEFEDVQSTSDDEAKEETQEEYDEMFTHLTRAEMALLKEDTDARMEALEQKGDVHDHERPVQHVVKFQDEESMNQFKSVVINRGYVITRGSEEFELIVLHITPMDKVKLMSNVYYLADVATAYQGVYKGWQSKAVY